MRVNRYRLAAKARAGHRGARLAARMLETPDKLIGLILLGNNVVNIAATLLAAKIALRLGVHEAAVVFVLTPIILIFAELAPKTLAAFKPETVAYPAAIVYTPLLMLFAPLVWLINAVANGLLTLFGVSEEDESLTSLTSEELRMAVKEAGALIPSARQSMLLRVLDLDSVTVEDIMIPRAEIKRYRPGRSLGRHCLSVKKQPAHPTAPCSAMNMKESKVFCTCARSCHS